MHRAKKKKKKKPQTKPAKKKTKTKKKAEPGVSIFFFFFFCFKSMRATRTIGLTAWVLLAAAVAAAQEMVLQELRRSPTAVVFEPFTGRYASRWSTSTHKKCTGIPTVRGAEQPAIEADRVLALDQAPARYCAWTPAPFNTTRLATEPLVIRFDVRRENEVPCGGAYLKLLDPRLSRAQRRGHIVTDTSGGGDGGAAAQPTPAPLNDDLSISAGGGGDDETGGGDGFSTQRLAAQQAAQQRAVLRSESRNGTFGPASPYALMFGPDACAARADGAGRVDQVHLILVVDGVRHRLVDPPRSRLDGDLRTHEYKLTVWPDTGAFEIQVDGFRMRHGSLADEGAFAPPLVPPSTIADPDDVEPADWPRDEFIPDPDASRPADWDESEPRMIPDPQARDPPAGWDTATPAWLADIGATRPDDWDDDEDGKWEQPRVVNPACRRRGPNRREVMCGPWTAPEILNPRYRGRWVAPYIRNPRYRGVWTPRRIPNPALADRSADEERARTAVARALAAPKRLAAAFEVWTTAGGTIIDNLYIGHSEDEAAALSLHTYKRKLAIESRARRDSGRRGTGFASNPSEYLYDWAAENRTTFLSIMFFCCSVIFFFFFFLMGLGSIWCDLI
jgi:hypothetical protein